MARATYYVDAVVSFSVQLESLLLGYQCMKSSLYVRSQHLTLAKYKEIARNCSGLRCSVSSAWDKLADALNGLGDRLVGIHLGGNILPDATAWQIASAKCTGLHEITKKKVCGF